MATATIDTNPSYVEITAGGDEAADATGSMPLGSMQINRFGQVMRKGKSHATLLGFHPQEYTPADRLQNVKDVVASGNSTPSFSMASFNLRSFQSGTLDQPPLRKEDSEAMLVEVVHLKEAGLNLEEITRYVYEHLENQELPNFMRYLHLDQDGGLDRVATLWRNDRIFWAFLLLAFVVMNILYLVSSNWDVFEAFARNAVDIDKLQELQVNALKLDVKKLQARLEKNVDAMTDVASHAAQADQAQMGIYSQIQDVHRRGTILKLAGMVGTWEVLWVLAIMLKALNELRVFLCDRSEYRQFRYATDLFEESLPILSTFSLLKMLRHVHPSLIAGDYSECMQQRSWLPGTTLGMLLTTVYFALTRLFLAVLAIGAFAMKLLAVGLKLIDPSYKFLEVFMQSFLLMNQCMGCLLVERLLQDRIFLFIFGGSDTDFREDELALKNVYRCRVAKQIWEEFWVKAKRFQGWKAFVVFMTLDHFDLQMLLINDPPETNPHQQPDDQFVRGESSTFPRKGASAKALERRARTEN